MRGVYASTLRGTSQPIGSSPRAWGIFKLSPPGLFTVRFIPTCVGFMEVICKIHSCCRYIPTSVGFMPFGVALFRLDTVHPHVRGVYAKMPGSQTTNIRFIPTCVGYIPLHEIDQNEKNGSSPRAWGLCRDVERHNSTARFIPTCVGFMRAPMIRKTMFSVHPHVRGVYLAILGAIGIGVRFIPTSVGFMPQEPLPPVCGAVHPHVRGVY